MKPLFLRLKAFGPFAGSVHVSFDRIFDGGLFLIHGRTGSGKTSLLDGLCFSLFGRPSSEEREKDISGLRSDLARVDVMTETELIFATGSAAYRVVRLPTQATPKKRGEGLTEHKGSAELSRFEGSLSELREMISSSENFDTLDVSTGGRWTPLAGKVEAVNEYVERLLGMNERQFRQVVVLPQGRFREFLSSSSTERQAILEKLFQTDRFSRLQTYVTTRAKADEAKFAASSAALTSKLKQFGLAQFDEIEDRKHDLRKNVDESTQARTAARTKSEALAAELNRAKEFEHGQRRHAALTLEAENLTSQASSIESSKLRVAEARKWTPFFQIEEQQSQALLKTGQRATTRAATQQTLAALGSSNQTTQKKLAVLIAKKPSLDEMATERTRLREILTILKDVEGSRNRIETERLQDVTERERAATTKLAAEKLETEQAALLNSLFSIDETLRAHEAVDFETEDRRLREIELNFHLSEAARLAATLRKGESCPVCGSLEHPRPARPTIEGGFTAEEIKQQRDGFEERRLRSTERRAKRQSRLEPYVARFGPPTAANVETLDFDSTFTAFENGVKRLREISAGLDSVNTALITREASRRESIAGLEEKLNAVPLADRSTDDVMKRGLELKKEQELRQPEIKSLELELAKSAGELARLQGTISTLDDEITRLEHENLERAASLERLKPSGPRPAERLQPSELGTIESAIESYNEKQTRNIASLHEVDQLLNRIQSTRSSAQIDEELHEATQARNELEQTVATQQHQLTCLLKLEDEVDAGRETLVLLKAAAERGARMAALLTGDRSQNKMLVPLSRFVLQSRFEEVLEQANRRLGRMSRGQFQLRRPALSRNLRDSQGLELSVEDSIVGKERHAGSLSGGESFMAALSLALGLADVVQADLGGIKLDSVLIDEGFGTLDSESLDLAMRTLVDLQDGGRVVGIISHVQELKSQVLHQLEVTKTPAGSRVDWRA